MSRTADDRVLVWSDRAEVRSALSRAFRRLGGRPVLSAAGEEPDPPLPPLALLDLAGCGLPPRRALDRLPAGGELVALVDAASSDRLIPALVEGCSDYLFFPLNRDEVRLLWSRHREGGPPPVVSLDRRVGGRFRLEFPSEARYVQPAVRRVVEACAGEGAIGPAAAFRLRVALGEAVSNAILYGNREDPSRRVRLEGRVERDVVRVTVADEGEGFDPVAVPDPTTGGRRERSSGRGLFLMRRLADEVRHNERGNEVTVKVAARPGGEG